MKKIGQINGIDVYESKLMPKNSIMMTGYKDLPSLKKLMDMVQKMPEDFYVVNIKK